MTHKFLPNLELLSLDGDVNKSGLYGAIRCKDGDVSSVITKLKEAYYRDIPE